MRERLEMAVYRVKWEYDIEADSPLEAAQKLKNLVECGEAQMTFVEVKQHTYVDLHFGLDVGRF